MSDPASPFDAGRIMSMRPAYKGFTSTSYHVPTRDGFPLAIDVVLPKGLQEGKKIPAIVHQTRYWRAYDFRPPVKWFMKDPYDPKIARVFAEHGHAFVIVDVRGTGASGGTNPYPFSYEEIMDGKDVMDWIIKQPWSNGDVVAYGNSYSGATAQLAAVTNHPALKGIVAKHDPAFDLYDIFFPGGCFNEKFIYYWSTLGKGLDQTKGVALKAFAPVNPLFAAIAPLLVKGVKPVPPDRAAFDLAEAARIHLANAYPHDYKDRITFRDDAASDGPGAVLFLDQVSSFAYKERVGKLDIPLYTVGSWMDSITADVVIDKFVHFNNPQRAVIGDWDHKALHRASPFHGHREPAGLPRADQVKDWLLFFDDARSGSFPREKILHYYTMGEERWKRTTSWPPAGQARETWYFHAGNALSREAPTGTSGSDAYRVDFGAGTGIRNRIYTLLSLPVHYPRRDVADARLLTYTSAPLPAPMEITGHPIATLHLRTDKDDGMVIAYLEFIDKAGGVHMVTEGLLRFMHRKVSAGTPPYKIAFPYHSFTRADALPVVPGEPMELVFALYPTSILLPAGSRLRVAIAGADKDTYARYPAAGDPPTLNIDRNAILASNISIPTMPHENARNIQH